MLLRSILVASILLAAPAAAAAQADTASPTVASVRAMLSGIEQGPGAAEWAAMGPAVVPVLATLASDTSEPGFIRIRAVQAARNFATPESRAMLRRALRSPEPLVVREAARSLQRAFGADSITELAPLLDHRDTAVRDAAIRALGAIASGTPTGSTPVGATGAPLGDRPLRALDAQQRQARDHLQRRLAHEGDEVLREEIRRQLSGVGGSSPG